jgi:hypothetical protein
MKNYKKELKERNLEHIHLINNYFNTFNYKNFLKNMNIIISKN